MAVAVFGVAFAGAAAICPSDRSVAQTTPQTGPPATNTQVAPPPLPGSQTPPVVVSPDAKTVPPPAGAPPSDTKPPPAPPAATPPPPAAASPAAPPPPAGTAPESPPAAPSPPEKQPAPRASGDASSATQLSLESRPVAILKGKSNWEDGFDTINASLKSIQEALKNGNVKTVGHPMTVFRKTDDNGFEYEAMVPIDPAADRKTKLAADVAFGQSPAGKVLRFEHRGAYEEIDSTYEAITAYLDEKGYDTKNLFMEEYLNSVKNADDADLKVDIYVLIK